MQIYGGAELLVVKLANYLTQNRVVTGLLTTIISPEIEADLRGVRIIKRPVPSILPGGKAMHALALFRQLSTGIREHLKQFDVINVHNYPAELSIFPHRKPVVWMCNEPPEIETKLHEQPRYSLSRFLIKGILVFDRYVVRKYIRNVVVADTFNQNRFRRIYDVNPHIIHYGIEYAFFADQKRNTKVRDTNRFTILHVGMLTPLKNQMESIKTIEALRNRIPGIKLILAGTGEDRYLNRLKSYVADRNLTSCIEFTGHVDRARVRDLYHESDVLLHPIKPQGGWLSPFEALCAKLPIIVSTEMTAADLIKKENLGVITNDYVSAVGDIYENQQSYRDAADWRASWVRNHLSWDRFGEKMVCIFAKTLGG